MESGKDVLLFRADSTISEKDFHGKEFSLSHKYVNLPVVHSLHTACSRFHESAIKRIAANGQHNPPAD